MVQGYLKEIQMKYQGRFICFSESFKEVSRVFQEIIKGVSRKFKGCFKKVSRVFQWSWVSRVFKKS